MSDPVDKKHAPRGEAAAAGVTVDDGIDLDAILADLEARVSQYNVDYDREVIAKALTVAASQHGDQRRASGEPYISHPVGTAIICADLGLDTATVVAALLHDVVEDTSTSIEEVQAEFGEEVALLVDGVTKLTQMSFRTVEEEQAENIRKMIIAMAKDIRVILIKLADRLHNMRTLSYLGKEKQIDKSRETLEVYAPLAHRLGIESIRWELEDLAFASLHPRKYAEVQRMVAQRRADRENDMEEARAILATELESVGIQAEIAGRTKHFYSIYDKMVSKGKEFNEIYDLTALRVFVSSVKDCYAALGIIHSLWKPLPGRFKDYVAMPKFNMYQSLHTTVIGPVGRPLEIQIRTYEMHETAEYGIAAHWMYKEGRSAQREGAELEKLQWLRQIMDWQSETKDAGEFMDSLRIDLFQDEVYVFTPKGAVKSLSAGATPVDFAYAIHTDVGHQCVGAKVDGRIVPLSHKLQSGDIVQILTSKTSQGPSRDWLQFVASPSARNKIKQWFRRERREDFEHMGREALLEALRRQGLPGQKLINSDLMGEIVKENHHAKREDFFTAIGSGKLSTQHVVQRVIQILDREGKTAAAAQEAMTQAVSAGMETAYASPSSRQMGISVDGLEDVAIRIPQCCRPVPGDDIVGYISLGKGVSIHRRDCPNVKALEKSPERFTEVHWDSESRGPLRVEIQIDAYDRTHLLEDISRTLSESDVNIVAAQIFTASNNMVRDRFVFDVPSLEHLETVLQRIRRIDTVYDAYRVTPQ